MARPAKVVGNIAVACLLCLGFWQLGQGAYIPAKAWLAQELMQRAWQRADYDDDRQAPWPWADTWPVARLKANAGEIDLIVLAGGSGRTLAFGPGHLSASALPGDRTIVARRRAPCCFLCGTDARRRCVDDDCVTVDPADPWLRRRSRRARW